MHAGNGLSDKPALFSSRSRMWTIDDYVEKDVPAIIRFVLKETKVPQVHFLGHSMVRVGCGGGNSSVGGAVSSCVNRL